jgi:hypothetical protein
MNVTFHFKFKKSLHAVRASHFGYIITNVRNGLNVMKLYILVAIIITIQSRSFILSRAFKNLKIVIYKTTILPVVLYGCESWSLTLREEHRLRVKNVVFSDVSPCSSCRN